tara:strand:- start:711 stop:1457 length:747 start_codon:yes stop_codon:yes gene_type:complete
MNKLTNFFKILNSRYVYTYDRNVIGNNGIYKDNEWHETRVVDNTFYSNPTNKNYYEMIFNDPSKISSANNLAKNFNFAEINKIGDIGGVPFSQAWTIKKINPHLNFHLTDYDEKSTKIFLDCPIFQSNNFSLERFDVIYDNLDIFNDCDLITMWGVDYALDDDSLLNIFKNLLKNNQKMLLASLDNENDNIFKNLLRVIYNSFESFFGRSRYHGILRNSAYFDSLCSGAGVKLKLVTVADGYRIYLIN